MARATHISKHDNVVNLERRETYASDDIVVNSYFSQFNGTGASHDDDQNKRTGQRPGQPVRLPFAATRTAPAGSQRYSVPMEQGKRLSALTR
jgi:hypothetical protein